jgi:integrase
MAVERNANPRLSSRSAHNWRVVARLRDGASLYQARADASAIAHRLLNVERNPIDLVEVKGISKRKKRPQVLQVKDAWQILDALVQPFRTIVLIGLCFGLRISEILGLRWTDFDFKRSVVLSQRSALGKRLNKLKTEYSQDEVPIDISPANLSPDQPLPVMPDKEWPERP